MTSIGLRPALLFLSSAGVNTTASISARKLSNGTTRSIISSGSPFAEIAASRLSASKNPSCPIGPTSANLVVISQTRTNWLRRLFFEAPNSQSYPEDNPNHHRCDVADGILISEKPRNNDECQHADSERARAQHNPSLIHIRRCRR